MAAPNMLASIRALIPVVLVLNGTTSAAVANVAKFRAPQKCRIVRVAASVGVKTAVTVLGVMVEVGGVDALSAAIDLNAPAVDTWTEGALSLAATNDLGVAVAKEAEITVDVTLTGTSFADLTVQIDLCPED